MIKACVLSNIELNEFMAELDKRYEVKIKKEGGAIMAKKMRKTGCPSKCPQPLEAPQWAICSSQSKLKLLQNDLIILYRYKYVHEDSSRNRQRHLTIISFNNYK